MSSVVVWWLGGDVHAAVRDSCANLLLYRYTREQTRTYARTHRHRTKSYSLTARRARCEGNHLCTQHTRRKHSPPLAQYMYAVFEARRHEHQQPHHSSSSDDMFASFNCRLFAGCCWLLPRFVYMNLGLLLLGSTARRRERACVLACNVLCFCWTVCV